MAKLTREQRVEIYNSRMSGESLSTLVKNFKICKAGIEYLIRLIDIHGVDILREEKNNYYSTTLKKEIIDKVLIDNRSSMSVALEYGLSSKGMLSNWIKSYKENGYVIVEKPRGRPPTMKTNQSQKEYKEMTIEEKNEYNEKRIQYLEAENEYLKKLRAVVQARKNRQPKKK